MKHVTADSYLNFHANTEAEAATEETDEFTGR
jgi:hypothetical protein